MNTDHSVDMCLIRNHQSYNVTVVWSLSHVGLFYEPIDSSPLSSSVHGFSQARILEWVAISYSRVSS